MKNIFAILMVMVVAAMLAAPSYAGCGDRMKSGVEKFYKSPLQLKDNVINEYNASKFKPFGVIGGGLKGVIYMVKDAVTGVVEVVTCPVDWKK